MFGQILEELLETSAVGSITGLQRFCGVPVLLQRLSSRKHILQQHPYFLMPFVLGDILLVVCDHVSREHFIEACAGHL
ncbi:hypothetical protein ABIF97_007228 [Bradyrhizobium japonicum]